MLINTKKMYYNSVVDVLKKYNFNFFIILGNYKYLTEFFKKNSVIHIWYLRRFFYKLFFFNCNNMFVCCFDLNKYINILKELKNKNINICSVCLNGFFVNYNKDIIFGINKMNFLILNEFLYEFYIVIANLNMFLLKLLFFFNEFLKKCLIL